jgi:hypothetical protein
MTKRFSALYFLSCLRFNATFATLSAVQEEEEEEEYAEVSELDGNCSLTPEAHGGSSAAGPVVCRRVRFPSLELGSAVILLQTIAEDGPRRRKTLKIYVSR